MSAFFAPLADGAVLAPVLPVPPHAASVIASAPSAPKMRLSI
jgi:hypothetical protein